MRVWGHINKEVTLVGDICLKILEAYFLLCSLIWHHLTKIFPFVLADSFIEFY